MKEFGFNQPVNNLADDLRNGVKKIKKSDLKPSEVVSSLGYQEVKKISPTYKLEISEVDSLTGFKNFKKHRIKPNGLSITGVKNKLIKKDAIGNKSDDSSVYTKKMVGPAADMEIEKSKDAMMATETCDGESAYDVAVMVREKYIIRAMSEHDTLYIYSKKTGCFAPCYRKYFAKVLFSMISDPEQRKRMSSHFTKEVFHFLVNDPSLQVTWDDFNHAGEQFINVKNGVLDIDKLEILPHDAAYMFTYMLQVNFPKEHRKPKKFLSVLEQCFDDERDRKLCMESLGYILSNNSTAKAIWFYTGAANSGKSMLLHLMRRIIGAQYVSSIPPERLEGRFDLRTAVHCRANIVFELNSMKLKEVKTLKAITGGDPVPIEGKYESTFYAKLPLKFLLAGNNPPVLELGPKIDDGILQRFYFLAFEHSVPPSERISEFDRILYEEEGDDIFYLLMKHLQKFYRRGCCFKLSNSSRQIADRFCGREKSSADKFIEQCCVMSSSGVVSVAELVKAYVNYCEMNGVTACNRNRLVQKVLSLPSGPSRDRVRTEESKNPISAIRGISLVRGGQGGVTEDTPKISYVP